MPLYCFFLIIFTSQNSISTNQNLVNIGQAALQRQNSVQTSQIQAAAAAAAANHQQQKYVLVTQRPPTPQLDEQKFVLISQRPPTPQSGNSYLLGLFLVFLFI